MQIEQAFNLFRENNPDFDFQSHSLSEHHDWSRLDKDSIQPDLQALQRIYRLYPDIRVAATIINSGYRSAHDIAASPEPAFKETVTPALVTSLPEGMTANELAGMLWSRARTVSFQVSQYAAGVQPHQWNQATYIHDGSLPDFHEGMPDWNTLFGPGYNATVKECASIYGAAAYFTDLMRIIQTYITTTSGTGIPAGLSLQERRPDLWQIPLDCFTTYHELTYLEIANQVMATKLSSDFQQDIAQYLATHYYPFSQPLNQPLEKIRMYLGHFGYTLADVYQRFQVNAADVARESLSMSIEKAALITASAGLTTETMYGLYSGETVDELTATHFFETKTGLLPGEVTSLVYQQLRPKQYTGLYFSGNTTSETNRIQVPNSPSLQITGSQTIEFWIYLPDVPVLGGQSDEAVILTKDDTGEFDIQIRADDAADIILCYRCGNGTSYNYLNVFDHMAIQTWYHVAIIRNMSPATPTLTSYSTDATGNVVSSGDSSFTILPIVSSTKDVFIGRSSDNGVSFNGILTEVRIWNRALSHDEIDNNRWRSLSGNEHGLAAYWPLNEGMGTVMNDHSGNASNGTLTTDMAQQWQPVTNLYFGDYEQNPSLQQQLWINNQGTGTAYLEMLKASVSTQAGPQICYSDNSDQWSLLGRFIHIARQLEWSFADMDWALKSIGSDGLQATDLNKIAIIGQLVKQLQQPVDAICALWYDMKTYGMGEEGVSQTLFDRVFNTPEGFYNPDGLPDAAPYRPVYTGNPFYHDSALLWTYTADQTDVDNGMIRGSLLSTLKLQNSSLTLLTGYLHKQGLISDSTLSLSVENMSLLYRYASLPAWCAMPVTQFLQLLSLLGDPALDNPEQVLEICGWMQWLKKNGLTVYQLEYLCGDGTMSEQVAKKYLQPDVDKFLLQLSQAASSTLFSAASLAGAGILQSEAEDIFNAVCNAGFCDTNGVILDERPLTAYGVYQVLASLTGNTAADKSSFDKTFTAASLSATDDIAIIRTFYITHVLENCRDAQTNLAVQQLSGLYKITAQQADAILAVAERQLPSAPGFDAASAMQLSIPFNTLINPATVTLSFWLQLSSVDDKQTLYSTINETEGFELLYEPGSTCFQLYLPDGTTVNLPWSVNAGEWYHVLLSIGAYSNDVTPYTWSLNGVVSSGSLSAPYTPATAGATSIGFMPGNGNYLSGTIIDFRLYEYYMQGREEILQEMAAAMPPYNFTQYLRAWWRLNSRDNITVYDWSGNDNDGTITLTGDDGWSWHDYSLRQLLTAIDADEDRKQDAYSLMQQLTQMNAWAKWFQLAPAEVTLISINPSPFGIPAMRYGFHFRFGQLCNFATYKKLHAAYRLPGPVLLEYFNIPDDAADKVQALANAMGWPEDQLAFLEQNFTYGSHPLAFPEHYDDFNTINGVNSLARCFEVSTALGVNIAFFVELRKLSDLALVTGNTTTDNESWTYYINATESLEHAVSAKYTPGEVKAVLQPVEDEVQVIMRNVMSRLLIWDLGATIAGIKTQQDLYEYLLIDVRMTNAVQMSLLKAGLNSLQLYVQRCLSNMENGVICTLPKEWWTWMGSYREWEANREIYVYPENYVDPTLRKEQSELFKNLVSQVKQQPSSEESVTKAYLNYLDGLKEIANLHIVDSYARVIPGKDTSGRILDVFGRTLTSPVTYYHRKAVIKDPASGNVSWTPWTSLGITINAEYVTPIYAFGKLFLFWVQQANESTNKDGSTYSYIKATIYYSFEKAGTGWVQPQVLTDDLIIKTFNASGAVTDYYFTFKMDGFNPMSAYEQTRAWNKVGAVLLPATDSEESKILITLGDAVVKINNPNTAFTAVDTPQTAEQEAVYSYLQNMADLALLKTGSGKVTTVVPAFLLDASLRSEKQIPLIDLLVSGINNGFLVPCDTYKTLGILSATGAAALTGDAGSIEPFIYNTPNNNAYHSWYNETGVTQGSKTEIAGPYNNKSITCLDYNSAANSNITLNIPDSLAGLYDGHTITLWVQFNSFSGYQTIFDNSDATGSTGVYLEFYNNVLKYTCFDSPNSLSLAIDMSAKVTGQWYFITASFYSDSGSMSLYDPVAGTWENATATKTGDYTYSSSDEDIFIGAANLGGSVGDQLDGYITGLRVFNYVFSGEAIFDMMVGKTTGNTALGCLPAAHTNVVFVKNQEGWFFLNAGKESFLAIPEGTGVGVTGPTITVGYGEVLSVGTSRSVDTPGESMSKYSLIRTSTNVIDDLLGIVNAGGMDKLLQPSSQRLPEPDFNHYLPNSSVVNTPYPLMNFNGAYGLYFRELFFYIPFYIAENLQLNLKFAAAKKWYEYIFDPNEPVTVLSGDHGEVSATITEPVAMWPLDAPAVDGVIASEAGAYSGTVSGTLQYTTKDGLPFSLQSRIITGFEGSNGSMLIPYNAALNPAEFTVSCWVYFEDDLPDTGMPTASLITDVNNNTGYLMELYRYNGEPTTVLVYVYNGTNSSSHQAVYSMSPGNWYQITLSVSTGSFLLYINGPGAPYTHTQTTATPYVPSTSTGFSVGSGFNGFIANLVFWDIPLSLDAIQKIDAPPTGLRHRLSTDRFWQFIPFRHLQFTSLYSELTNTSGEYLLYEYDPFDPDAIASQRPAAYAKGIFMRYISNLIDYGDNLFLQDTWESITAATMYYVLASDLLGRPPRQSVTEKHQKPATYNEIAASSGTKGVPTFLIDLETAPVLSSGSTLTAVQAEALEQRWSVFSAYFGIPENKQLLTYRRTIEDRLYKIRHGLNINGQTNNMPLFQPPINPAAAAAAAAPGGSGVGSISSAAPAVPYYRFSYLVELARNFTTQVLSLGNELLAALEKQDGEHLSLLRETQGNAIYVMMTQIKQDQVNELYAQQSNLQASLVNAQLEQQTYSNWIANGWNQYETGHLSMLGKSAEAIGIATLMTLTSSAMYLLPDIFGLSDGGMNFGGSVEAIGQAAKAEAELSGAVGAIMGIKGNFERMNDQWTLQLNIAKNSITGINAQLQANDLAISVAEQDYNVNQAQIEQSNAVISFLQTKFTSEALYEWIASEVSSVYYQAYQLACGLAQMAQTAYQYELSRTDTYINTSSWSNQYRGLQAGDALLLSINQLEQAYIKQNSRSLEISRTISLSRLDPDALINLKTKETCQFQLTEYLFDTDFPGHYNRKIKSISITVPAVVGPYQNVKATLTQTSNSVVTKASVQGVSYLLGASLVMPADGSLRMNWNPGQAIALSSGTADNGMFQLNFNDERYLPFENTGAVSSWQLDMPKAANQFDFHTINDVIIELKYCATDGGSSFRSGVLDIKDINGNLILQQYKGSQLLSLRQQYGDAWQQFLTTQQMSVDLVRRMYPPNLSGVSLVAGENTSLTLIPVLSDTALLADISSITLSGNDWDHTTGEVTFEAAVPVNTGVVVKWPLDTTIVADSGLLNGTAIDPRKWLDIILVIPYDGALNWS